MSSEAKQDGPVRLSVNLSPKTAARFKALAELNGLSITEGIDTAIKVWAFLDDAIAVGDEPALIEPDGTVVKIVLPAAGPQSRREQASLEVEVQLREFAAERAAERRRRRDEALRRWLSFNPWRRR